MNNSFCQSLTNIDDRCPSDGGNTGRRRTPSDGGNTGRRRTPSDGGNTGR